MSKTQKLCLNVVSVSWAVILDLKLCTHYSCLPVNTGAILDTLYGP